MKIRTRLAIAFVTITVVPIVLIFVAAFGLVNYQEHLFQKTYGLSEQIDLLSGNQTQVFNRLTQGIQEEIREAVGENTDLFEEPAYLSKVNEELRDKYSYLVIRKGKDITFCGSEDGRELCERLAPYGDQGSMAGSIYMCQPVAQDDLLFCFDILMAGTGSPVRAASMGQKRFCGWP